MDRGLKLENAEISEYKLKGKTGDLKRLIDNPNMILVLSGEFRGNKLLYKVVNCDGNYTYMDVQTISKYAASKLILNAMVNTLGTEVPIKGNNWEIPVLRHDDAPATVDKPEVFIVFRNSANCDIMFLTRDNRMAYNKFLPKPKVRMAVYSEYIIGTIQFNEAGDKLFNDNYELFKKHTTEIKGIGPYRYDFRIRNCHHFIKSFIEAFMKVGFKNDCIEVKPFLTISTSSSGCDRATFSVVDIKDFSNVLDRKVDLSKTIYGGNFEYLRDHMIDKAVSLKITLKRRNSYDYLEYFAFVVFYECFKKYLAKLATELKINTRKVSVDRSMYKAYMGGYYSGLSGLEANVLHAIEVDFEDLIESRSSIIEYRSSTSSNFKPILPSYVFKSLN